jgi:hypothetical protein
MRFLILGQQWRLLRGGWFIIMAGMEQMEWHETH